MLKKGILLHEANDDVGVVTMDLTPGETVQAVTLEGDTISAVELVDDVPLAHKVSVRALQSGEDVVEYGRAIGSATGPIEAGAHVHTHNVKGKRWSGRSQIVEHHRSEP